MIPGRSGLGRYLASALGSGALSTCVLRARCVVVFPRTASHREELGCKHFMPRHRACHAPRWPGTMPAAVEFLGPGVFFGRQRTMPAQIRHASPKFIRTSRFPCRRDAHLPTSHPPLPRTSPCAGSPQGPPTNPGLNSPTFPPPDKKCTARTPCHLFVSSSVARPPTRAIGRKASPPVSHACGSTFQGRVQGAREGKGSLKETMSDWFGAGSTSV